MGKPKGQKVDSLWTTEYRFPKRRPGATVALRYPCSSMLPVPDELMLTQNHLPEGNPAGTRQMVLSQAIPF